MNFRVNILPLEDAVKEDAVVTVDFETVDEADCFAANVREEFIKDGVDAFITVTDANSVLGSFHTEDVD